jgi:hypothetical protein
MDGSRLDILARSLTDSSSRRGILRGLAAALGLQAARVSPDADAKKRKTLRLNAFGCVDVGGTCRGKAKHCCSGICQGKKPKRGERDKSRCIAHGESTCPAGHRDTGCGGSTTIPCTTSTGFSGGCDTTTGNAGFCGHGFICMSCRKDGECRKVCGSAAACIPCPNCDGSGTTDTACVGPNPTDCGSPP